ncbi:hypothetical protein BDW02DRAFT_566839 [Decorospora gaudefroyi]|uniref:Uncharacterized protein n=1 Tax=Decorospora gaudefroyi TaxID=184978 RepID=A0A6A5KEI5_9PLEO|nr:hypothetical protein BDW02DRAFT_566839 [Decorospora gaudefroyi]
MSLANLSLQPSYTTLARSATIATSRVFVARERLQQIKGHLLTRPYRYTMTMIWSKFKKAARDNNNNNNSESSQPTTTTMTASSKKATTTAAPSEKETKPSSGAVNIDQDVEDKFQQLPPLPSPLPTPHKEFLHCMPPEPPTYRKYSVFAAGSIEMGAAVQWQKHMAVLLSPLPITVCNPRRGHWDPNITPEAKDADFNAQVQWELGALEQADVICFFFDHTTKSPVTMLELGLWAASDKVVVCCDKRFWKQGNVEIVCNRYSVPLVRTFADLVPEIEKMLRHKGMQLDGNGDLVGENVHTDKPKPKKIPVLEAEKRDLQRQIEALQTQLQASKM